jgi:hypothetical protein
MNKILIAGLILVSFGALTGCNDNGPATGEDVAAKIKAMPAEERFKLIKVNTGMGLAMKDKAIDELPVSAEQKAAWKQEIRDSGGAPAASGRP